MFAEKLQIRTLADLLQALIDTDTNTNLNIYTDADTDMCLNILTNTYSDTDMINFRDITNTASYTSSVLVKETNKSG